MRTDGLYGRVERQQHCILSAIQISIRRQHTSAYVSIRQHTSAGFSIRQHTSAYVSIWHSIRQHTSAYVSNCQQPSAYVRIRVHASANVSERQRTSAYVSILQHTSAYGSMRQHKGANISICQHTSAYVSIRQHTSAYVHQLSICTPPRHMYISSAYGLHNTCGRECTSAQHIGQEGSITLCLQLSSFAIMHELGVLSISVFCFIFLCQRRSHRGSLSLSKNKISLLKGLPLNGEKGKGS
jgi:hypothetical protein